MARFQAGQSGNPGGRPKGPTLSDALRAILAETDRRGRTNYEMVARKLLGMAKGGHIGALQLLYERIDGKVPQALHHSGPDGSPLPIVIVPPDTAAEAPPEPAE